MLSNLQLCESIGLALEEKMHDVDKFLRRACLKFGHFCMCKYEEILPHTLFLPVNTFAVQRASTRTELLVPALSLGGTFGSSA